MLFQPIGFSFIKTPLISNSNYFLVICILPRPHEFEEGLPIAHEVHPDNTAEAKTLLPMIRGLLERHPLKRVVLVTNTDTPAAEVVQRYKSLADIERGFRALAVRQWRP